MHAEEEGISFRKKVDDQKVDLHKESSDVGGGSLGSTDPHFQSVAEWLFLNVLAIDRHLDKDRATEIAQTILHKDDVLLFPHCAAREHQIVVHPDTQSIEQGRQQKVKLVSSSNLLHLRSVQRHW